jgi:hypothetical protein
MLRRATELDEWSAVAWGNYGNPLAMLGDLEGARTSFRRAIALDNATIWAEALAVELALVGDTTGALREIRLLQGSADTEYDMSMRAFVLARTGHRAEAEATIRRLEQRPAGRRPNAVMIGRIAGLGDWDRALAEFIKGRATPVGRLVLRPRAETDPRVAPVPGIHGKMNLQDQPIARASAQ